MVELPDVTGLALNLERTTSASCSSARTSSSRRATQSAAPGKIIQVPVGEALLGRVVDPLNGPLDDRGPIETTEFRPVEFEAPSCWSAPAQ